MRKKGYHQMVITLLIGLVLTLAITISPATAIAGTLNFNIDFESPPLNDARRQVINPYIDPYRSNIHCRAKLFWGWDCRLSKKLRNLSMR